MADAAKADAAKADAAKGPSCSNQEPFDEMPPMFVPPHAMPMPMPPFGFPGFGRGMRGSMPTPFGQSVSVVTSGCCAFPPTVDGPEATSKWVPNAQIRRQPMEFAHGMMPPLVPVSGEHMKPLLASSLKKCALNLAALGQFGEHVESEADLNLLAKMIEEANDFLDTLNAVCEGHGIAAISKSKYDRCYRKIITEVRDTLPGLSMASDHFVIAINRNAGSRPKAWEEFLLDVKKVYPVADTLANQCDFDELLDAGALSIQVFYCFVSRV